MDPKLAELYGTIQSEETDVEKLAAAELAEKLGEGQEIDVNNLSDEDVEALATEVLAAEQGGAAPAGDPQEVAQEKVAEADYLGRVMAHAYVAELKGIEKEAAAKTASGGKVMAALKTKKAGAMPPAFLKGKKDEKESGKKSEKESKESEKKSSALETLAERRAVEICEANNIDPTKLTLVEAPAQEKTSAADALEQAVNAKAIEMLAAYGVEVKTE
jgi:hypothetical protein